MLTCLCGQVPRAARAEAARGRDHQHQVQAAGQSSGRPERHQLPGGHVSHNTPHTFILSSLVSVFSKSEVPANAMLLDDDLQSDGILINDAAII